MPGKPRNSRNAKELQKNSLQMKVLNRRRINTKIAKISKYINYTFLKYDNKTDK